MKWSRTIPVMRKKKVAPTKEWRRKWQATPVFLPGKPHGQSSLVGYSPWGWKESDRTELTERQQQRAVEGSWCLEGNDPRKNSYIYIVNGKSEGERR